MDLPEHLRDDLRAAVVVALLALPLSLGIAAASGFPPISGIVTVAVGGLVCLAVSKRSFLIKGPAAGLITILAGAVLELGALPGFNGIEATLAIICVAGAIQIAVSRLDVSRWVERVPEPVITAMLVAIGIAILRTQVPIVLGLREGLSSPPHLLTLAVGVATLALLLGWRELSSSRWRVVPGAVVAVLVGVVLSLVLARHGQVEVIEIASDPLAQLPRPDFRVLAHPVAWRWTLVLAAIGTLESVLTVKFARCAGEGSSERVVPERDLLWVGVGNVLAPLLGGLPMISEVVRTTANHEQGAKTRRSASLHALFVVIPVIALPFALALVPRAALAAVIVGAGLSLMAPRRWWGYRERKIDMLSFALTVVLSVGVDLLVGVGAGLALHLGLTALTSPRTR